MKDISKGGKYVYFIDEKSKDGKLKEEPIHKLSTTEIHQTVHILEVPLKMTEVTTTLDLATKVYAMAILLYNRESNTSLQQIVFAIASSIIYAGVSSDTKAGHRIPSKDLLTEAKKILYKTSVSFSLFERLERD